MSSARPTRRRLKYSAECPPDHGAIAPSLSESESSGTTNSSSTSSLVPIPVQSGQAPNGELKENERGSISSKDNPQSWQAMCSENTFSFRGSVAFRSTKSNTTNPFANFRAVSIESVIRDLDSFFTASRSTTTSIECFSCFFSFGTSLSAYTTPSTLAREKP